MPVWDSVGTSETVRSAISGPRLSAYRGLAWSIVDGHGKTLIPGLVGMHEHLFYPAPIAGPPVGIEQLVTFPLDTWRATAR
jgi:cytosine/adenosine deaminase-related metal-dependent hydrolase